jgi:hypothetical protein
VSRKICKKGDGRGEEGGQRKGSIKKGTMRGLGFGFLLLSFRSLLILSSSSRRGRAVFSFRCVIGIIIGVVIVVVIIVVVVVVVAVVGVQRCLGNSIGVWGAAHISAELNKFGGRECGWWKRGVDEGSGSRWVEESMSAEGSVSGRE